MWELTNAGARVPVAPQEFPVREQLAFVFFGGGGFFSFIGSIPFIVVIK